MENIKIATTSERHRVGAKLLVIHPNPCKTCDAIEYLNREAITGQFRPGDVLVVNAASTLPASFSGRHQRSNIDVELRLARQLNPGNQDYANWEGILFGAGDWREPTEDRIAIPSIRTNDLLLFSHGLKARIIEVSEENGRYVEIEFLADEADLLHKLYLAGRLIQYSYHERELDLWDGQTIFAGKPLALEPPSASFALTWDMMQTLQEQGLEVVYLYHAAGISSSGEKSLDVLLPLPEYYDIPAKTAERVTWAIKEHRRIIAVGTSVTRALESAINEDGTLKAGDGIATLKLSPSYRRKIVSGLLTGMHEAGTSHLQLLQSFAPWRLIKEAYQGAKDRDFLWHEYGDICLIL